MVIVLETDVIVSALLSPDGPPAEIIDRWEAGEFEVAISPPLLAELERGLQYPRVQAYLKRSRDEVAAFVERFRRVATVVDPQLTVDVIDQDPAANRVLECAVAGSADTIVIGDGHLLGLKAYRGIVVLRPAELLALLRLS